MDIIDTRPNFQEAIWKVKSISEWSKRLDALIDLTCQLEPEQQLDMLRFEETEFWRFWLDWRDSIWDLKTSDFKYESKYGFYGDIWDVYNDLAGRWNETRDVLFGRFQGIKTDFPPNIRLKSRPEDMDIDCRAQTPISFQPIMFSQYFREPLIKLRENVLPDFYTIKKQNPEWYVSRIFTKDALDLLWIYEMSWIWSVEYSGYILLPLPRCIDLIRDFFDYSLECSGSLGKTEIKKLRKIIGAEPESLVENLRGCDGPNRISSSKSLLEQSLSSMTKGWNWKNIILNLREI